jgi:DNA-binding CsgD family transcriptional regulator
MLRALDEAKAWCSGFGGSPAAPSGEVGVLTASGPYTVVARAIDLARRREWSRATELIDEVLLARSPGGSAVPFASEEPTTTPLAEAHLRVVRALVDIAVGRLARAATDLERAAMTLPVGIPFAGLGLAALNRLSIIVRHTSSPLYPSLVMVGGVATDEIVRRESLVDDALMASLDGDHERAAVLMRVVNDHLEGAAARSFDLPTPDEAQLWLAAGEQESATRCLQSARSDRAVSTTPAIWRGRLALAASGEIEALSAEVAPLTSTMDSLYERARTELELSVALDRAGDDRSRLHLAAARHLFARAGAAPPGGEAGAALGLSGPLALHRDSNVGSHREAAPWMTQLTSREVDVALGVVEGRSNRDVARALHLSVRTVETHLGRVFAKLDVHSRTQLAHLAHLTSDLENPA